MPPVHSSRVGSSRAKFKATDFPHLRLLAGKQGLVENFQKYIGWEILGLEVQGQLACREVVPGEPALARLKAY